MVLTFIKMPDEPIVIIRGDVDFDDYLQQIEGLNARLVQVIEDCGAPLYRIADLSQVDISYADILLWLEAQEDIASGSFIDQRIRPVVVGDHPLIQVGIKQFADKFNRTIAHFATLQAALAHIRAELADDGDD
jgi:hypothetical protein